MAGQLSNIGSQAITLEQLHTDVMTGSLAADDQSAGSSTMQVTRLMKLHFDLTYMCPCNYG